MTMSLLMGSFTLELKSWNDKESKDLRIFSESQEDEHSDFPK